MFLKGIKIKSNNTLKASDKKLLKMQFKKFFPTMSEQEIETVITKKDTVSLIRAETANFGVIPVYCINKHPIAFVYDCVLFPSIYLLWDFPNITRSFTMHDGLLVKLTDGAHLMLPGVAYPSINNLKEAPRFPKNIPAYINMVANKAAVAVGITARSSDEMIESNFRGRCITVFHVLGDNLCSIENAPCMPLPQQGSPSYIKQLGPVQKSQAEEVTAQTEMKTILKGVDNLELDYESSSSSLPSISLYSSPELLFNSPEDMDRLIYTTFLSVLKYVKNLPLPILSSHFYRVYMIPACPVDVKLDIKKSSYKKFGIFLRKMEELKLARVEELQKGVDTITEIYTKNPIVLAFFLDEIYRPSVADAGEEVESNIIESRIVTTATAPLFAGFKLTKGSIVADEHLKDYVVDYVKQHNLALPGNRNLVKLDALLKTICPGETAVSWQELMECVYRKMTSCIKITCADKEIIKQGKLELINIKVVNIMGTKKVTTVDNLSVYGIDMDEFALHCRTVGASTSINRPLSNRKTDQLQVQGNQVAFIGRLLRDRYKVPKKYITGLELASTKK